MDAPFAYEVGVDEAYKLAREVPPRSSLALENEGVVINKQQELFEVAVTNWRDLKTCRSELLSCSSSSGTTCSSSLDIFTSFRADALVGGRRRGHDRRDQEAAEGGQDAAARHAQVGRAHRPHGGAGADVDLAAARAGPARRRDARAPLDAADAGVRQAFVMDDKLPARHAHPLELDKYQDAVTEIVERARAEIKIDLQLQKIIGIWGGLSLEYVPFKKTGVKILVQPGEVYEALDDNEVALQNMMGNRFMGFFEATITEWKGKLGTVRSVLEVWLEVQRSWTQLESIFLASEDIREQLPEDAKRFDGIDAAFREQMADASQNNSPIEVCTASGREEVFQANFAALELCQKSLSDYLEVKKKKFPRFYFISANDLVDILSKGRYPPSVQEQSGLSKFTDAHRLDRLGA